MEKPILTIGEVLGNSDIDPDVRKAAEAALNRLGPGTQRLEQALTDDPDFRAGVRAALSPPQFTDAELRDAARAPYSPRHIATLVAAIEALSDSPTDADRKGLMTQPVDSETGTPWSPSRGASAMEDRVAELVRRLGCSESAYTRMCAAQDLGDFRPAATTALPALAEALGDKAAGVRRNAALALGSIRREGPVEADVTPIVDRLTAVLDSSDRLLCSTAAWALGQFGKDAAQAVPKLERLLTDDESGDDARTALESIRSALARPTPAE